MTVARSVADVLDDHVVFEVESIDRMYLNVWQPRLAYGGGVQGFFVGHRGYHYASTALMDPMTKTFVADIHGFVAARSLDLVSFAKGQRKDDLAQQFLAKFTDDEGGRCQMVCVRPEPRLRSNTDSWVLSRDTRWVSRTCRSRVRPGRRSTTCSMRGCSTS